MLARMVLGTVLRAAAPVKTMYTCIATAWRARCFFS